MKIKKTKIFAPITLTIETEEEFEATKKELEAIHEMNGKGLFWGKGGLIQFMDDEKW